MHDANDERETLLRIAQKQGFESIGLTEASALAVNPEVRIMCASGRCQAFGHNWMCPPACGTLEQFEQSIREKSLCIVVQTVADLEDEFDVETMMDAEITQKQRFLAFAKELKGTVYPDALCFAAGTCTLCPNCSYPDNPCRRPDDALVSMEAAGLMVNDVCQAAGIPYNHGKLTIAYTSCALV